jgi:ATP-dependent Clp protease ATP-binding subunit ClpA
MAKQPKMNFSGELEQTLHRSLAIANEREVEFSTLEHLLLALTDDSDAVSALKACAVDVQAFQSRVVEFLQTQDIDKLAKKDDAKPTEQFQRVIQRAVIYVQSSNGTEVNGVNVLSAVFAERESAAARILQEFQITRYGLPPVRLTPA